MHVSRRLALFIKPPPGLEGTPFVASRARFLAGADVDAHAFDPALWMPYLEAACYLEPRLLLDPSPPKCDIPIAKFRAPRTEALEFIRQLDKTGRLFLSEPELAPKGERMSLIAVFKNAEIDRTVWDRRRRNNLEFHIRGAAACLPAGYELTELCVGPGMQAYLYTDDIADMYPSFLASAERARTNALAIELSSEECAGLKALKRFKGAVPPTLVPCCQSLVMGDLNAVDFATGAHEMVLEYGGALPPEERMLHGHPPPRGRRMHCLVIDDHVGLAVGASRRDPVVRELETMFDNGTIACTNAKLPQQGKTSSRCHHRRGFGS